MMPAGAVRRAVWKPAVLAMAAGAAVFVFDPAAITERISVALHEEYRGLAYVAAGVARRMP